MSKYLGIIIMFIGVGIMVASSLIFNEGVTKPEIILDMVPYIFGVGVWFSGFFIDKLEFTLQDNSEGGKE